ncbi:MAG TPA: ThuA domain-containing protein, partial [Bacteroidota bacterium]|nr:ThuA domain-containing protein [Bacteroidota bacterium]
MAPLIGASPGKTLHGRRVRPALGALLVALLTFVVPAHAQPSRETFERILEAAPGAPTARPKHPRLLLIFNRSEGYRHSAIPFGAAALEVIGKKTGAYETVQSEDPAMLRPENLNRFDAVCLNNTTQLKIEDPLARKGLLDFISGGKGIIGIHAATDNFPTWSEGQEMLGGVFDGHPWTADGTWQVENEDPAHPLNAAFGGKGFLIKDEIYRIRQIELRKNSRVLLGLDMKAARNRTAIGVRSTDRDIPISWVRTYGKGRLFYCSLGHNESVYTNPAVLRHYLDGIQFALGDLEVETTPVGFNPMTFYDADRLTGLLRRVSAYQYGESRAALTEMNAFIRGVEDIPEARERMEGEFLSFLQGGGTLAGKQFICAKLALTGSAAAAGVLSAMLADSATSDMALSALESIGGPASEAALEAALTRTDGRTLAGVITALGNLRATRTIPRLEALSCHSEPGVSIAAISALGNMGTPASGAGLERLLDSTRGEVRAEIPGAMLACAERLRSGGDSARALRLYTLLSHAGYPAAVRGAALRGRVLSRPGSGGELIRETLRGSDSTLHGTAARL